MSLARRGRELKEKRERNFWKRNERGWDLEDEILTYLLRKL